MVAETALAEKIDLDLVLRKSEKSRATEGTFGPDPYNKRSATPREDVQARIQRLQETIDMIRATTKNYTASVNATATNSTAMPTPAPANSTPPSNANYAAAPVVPLKPIPQAAAPASTAAPAAQPQRPASHIRPRPARPAPNPAQRPQAAAPRPAAATASMPVPIADVQRWKQYRGIKLSMPDWIKHLPDIGVSATAAWVTGATLYLGGVVGWENVITMPAHQLGSVIAGIAAPLALMWMGINYASRQRDVQEQMKPLLHQIDQLVNPNKAVEARIDAVADGLRRQANELINAANQVEKTLGNVREGLRSDMEKMMEYAGLTGKHLEQASLSMSNRTTQLARLTEQMHGRLASFEEHAKQGTDRIDQSVNDMMGKAQGATDKLERQANNIVAALHAANMRMVRTAEDLDSRIGQIGNLADQTAVRFGTVAAEFGRQGAVVDHAAQVIENQMSRMQDVFSQQLAEMGAAIAAFTNVGYELSGAVNNFRNASQEVVGAAVNQIESYTSMMDTHLSDASAMLDRTASVAVSRAAGLDSTVAAQMQQMQQSLRDAAAETPRVVKNILDETTRRLLEMDMRFTGAGAQVTQQLSDLERGIDGRLSAMVKLAERMSEDTSGQMRDAVVGLFKDLQDLKSDFTEQAGNTQSDLKAFHNDLAQTIEALAHVARRATDRTVERILMLNAGVSQRIMDLRDTADNAHSQGQVLEGRLAQHIGMLREASDHIDQQSKRLETRGTDIVSDLRDATGQAMAQVEVMAHVIGREAEALRAATEHANTMLDDAGSALEMTRSELYATIAASATQIAGIVRDLDTQRDGLQHSQQQSATAHAALYHEILRLRNATYELNNQVQDTNSVTDARARDLAQLVTRLGEATMGIKAVTQNTQHVIADSAERIESVTDGSRQKLIFATQQMAEATAQIALESDKIAGSLDKQQSALERNVTTGAQMMDRMIDKLQTAASDVGITAEATSRDLDWLIGQLQMAGSGISFLGQDATQSLNHAREALVRSEAALQRTASSARVNLAELGSRYEAEGGRAAKLSSDVERRYADAITRLERLGHELTGQAFQAYDSLQEMGTMFDARIAQLRDGSHGATVDLQSVVAQMQQGYASLTSATEAAASQLAEIQSSLAQTGGDINLNTEHARTQVAAVRRELGSYAQDLMMMVAQASGQIEAAAGSFAEKASAVRAAANENAGELGELGARVRAEIEQLVTTVQQATSAQDGTLPSAVERLRAQSEQLVRQSQQSMAELERYGIRTTQNLQQLTQGADQAAARVQTIGAALQQQGQVIVGASTEAMQRVAAAGEQMKSQADVIRTAADAATQQMQKAGQQIMGQAVEWQTVATKVTSQITQIADAMAQQVAQIDSITVKAEGAAQRVQQAETKARRDAFLSAAKYLIESLNSLAIDLTRVLDPQEADRVWKEFAKGDATAFTRRFLQLREEVPAQQLRAKFERDGEFRTYALRYFRQFEELFEQAIGHDHNDLLATTLTTSDVGKLYSYLAGALGHSKLKAAASKAA